ncbi:predicted protein [Lichtheimia corymbifera JMRC:FSU:9682]|uniref:C3HC-type domain-containing protein n=1 Tax=Lichtheimia corymbifera JMRC:FSU:9682 TaxID=1263082 RepID=A0A068S8C2_9FUNG|nr:predicted protein [Lichtheimia corymbifera JMRC:FSU:9682]
MDTTSDLLKVCNETRELVANILKGKRPLKRTVEETAADSSLPNDAQLPDKRSRNDYDIQPSENGNDDNQVHLTQAYDRAKFYERLETFADAYIENKRPLTAIQCAMHGFADTHQLEGPNHDIAKLECVECKGTNYVIDISNTDEQSVRLNQVVEKYTSGLYTFHCDECFWRNNACPATIYSFPKLSTVEAVDMIRKSGREWLQSGVRLPKIIHPLNSRQSTQLDFLIRDFQNPDDRYKFTISVPSDLTDAVGTSYLLPVFGWHYAKPNIIKCTDCFRKKNLHELAALESSFNVIKEHRVYCPWINCNNAHVEPPQPTPFMRQFCGYEWMLSAVDLEYALLLRMQEESPVYQASREQWFIDEQKRMEKLRETLDREFTVFSQQPESPPPSAPPSEEHALPTIAITDEQPRVEKPSEEEAPATTSPTAQPQPSPSPGKQDEDDLGEYLESENEAEEEEEAKEPAATTTTTTTTVAENKEEEEVAKQPEFEDEEELDESLLEEVGNVTEPEQTEEDYKLMDTTAVNEEQAEKMDVDEQESTAAAAADTPLHLDTLEDHDMEEVSAAATETEPAELGQVIETTTTITPPSIAEKEEGEVTSVTGEENTPAAGDAIDMTAEESSVAPSDVATETIDKGEQPTATASDNEKPVQLQPEQVSEAASTDEITAMDEVAALVETPKDVLQGEPETPQHDQTLSAEDELKEFAESPLPTTAEESQEADTTDHPDINTPSQAEEPETQVAMPDDAQVEEKEHEDVTLDTAAAAPQTEKVQEGGTVTETKESAGSTTEAAQQSQDDLLLEDDQELGQKAEAKEALEVESAAQDDGISTPMDVYIEEESGDVTESAAPETSANIEADAQKATDKDESLLGKEEESLVNKEDESTVDEKKEESRENKEEDNKEEPLANQEDVLVEEKQEEGLVGEKESEPTATATATEKGEQVVEEQQPIVEEPSVKEEAPVDVPETTADNTNDAQQPTVPTVTIVEEQEKEDDNGIVPVGNAGSMDEVHTNQPQAVQEINTPTHVEEEDDTAIMHVDQQKEKEQPPPEDADMQIGDDEQAQDNNDDGGKGDAMDEVEVEVHEVPDSIGEEKVLKEEGMVNKEGTSNIKWRCETTGECACIP